MAGFAFVQSRRVPAPSGRRQHLNVSLPGDGGARPAQFALSPDGRSVVVPTAVNNQLRLIVRSLESGAERTLAGTEVERSPFWSADSRTIGFFA
jgi:hypothetical protein